MAGWFVTVVLDAVLTLLTAAAAARWRSSDAVPVAHVGVATFVRRTAAVALVAALLDLVLRSLSMADAPWSAVGDVVPTVLAHSRVGQAWLVGAASLVMLWATATATTGRRQALAWIALAGWATSRAAVSHAGADGLGWPVALQVVHLLAMGAWVGSVWMAAVGVGWPVAAVSAHDVDGAATERLSTVSAWALAIVVVTGVISARRHVPGVAAAWSAVDAYTGWLRLKLCCVAGAVAIGAFNRWFTLPRLRTSRRNAVWMQRFRWLLQIESVLLLAALVAAARLGSTEPPEAPGAVRPATSPS